MNLYAQDIDHIKNKINELGLSPEQAKQIAKEKGYSNSQLENEAKARGLNLKNIESSGLNEKSIQNSTGFSKINSEESNQSDNQISDNINIPKDDILQYFGYEIFQGDPKVFQSSSFGAIDPNYNIGPGDQIIVMLWGESQFRQQFIIDREGYVFVPEVGQVFVNGLDLKALEKKFFQILSKVYSTLNPTIGQPTTFVDVSIGELRPLRIIVLGELSQPGAYSVSPSTSLSSSLYYFNGPTTFGSLRDIRIIRKGKVIGSIDFYDYLLSGNVPNDIRLQMDDVIFIPPRRKTISIEGEINRQGIYELKNDENLSDLIDIAGNLSVSAYTKRAQISRIIPEDDRHKLKMDRMIIDVNLVSKSDIELHDGDKIKIFPIKDVHGNTVSIISNSVVRPGIYQLLPEMRILDLINLSDGLLTDAYLEKAHIRRISKDLNYELISINLKKLINGDLDQNIKLQFMDELIIYNSNEINNTFTNVTINGPVKFPGSYTLLNNKTLGDLIILSGGFDQSISKVKISVARLKKNSFTPEIFNFPVKKNKFIRINDLSNSNNVINNFKLNPHDVINIYSDIRDDMIGLVNISGSVLYPGNYPIISSNDKVSDIIKRAGGILPQAYPMASSFKRGSKRIKLSFESIINNNTSQDNFNVMENDSIYISKKTNIIDVFGEINQPGSYKYYNKYNLADYINLAGGFTVNAEKREVWVTYPNGVSRKYIKFFPSPKIFDSSVISVRSKPESEPLDKTEFAKELASIISDILQIALTLTLLSNSTGS